MGEVRPEVGSSSSSNSSNSSEASVPKRVGAKRRSTSSASGSRWVWRVRRANAAPSQREATLETRAFGAPCLTGLSEATTKATEEATRAIKETCSEALSERAETTMTSTWTPLHLQVSAHIESPRDGWCDYFLTKEGSDYLCRRLSA